MQALKVVFVLGLTLSVTFAVIPGRITPLQGVQLVEAKELLTRTLEKLATGDGPNYQ
ncbi:uncharacterized protein LOC108105232 isoform X2 [Drosophila eugracilis]|nr:uncharacterized protein LOC108105232 isoform X2 [Drosophila eugracilis]